VFLGSLVNPLYPSQERGFSVILSDMCPAVSGITTKDEAISCELGMRAVFGNRKDAIKRSI
jgi:23S rRNA U2552 (ribose-2'-O)-methylase RlmE/FtsJ